MMETRHFCNKTETLKAHAVVIVIDVVLHEMTNFYLKRDNILL